MIEEKQVEDKTATLATQLAAPLLAEQKRKKKFLGRRNRSNWKRMNRPSKTNAIDLGAGFINRFLARIGI